MKDVLMLVGIVAGWIALNIWGLPWFGIRTCMSGACQVPHVERNKEQGNADKSANSSFFELK